MLSTASDKKHHELELEVLKNANCILSIGKTMSDEFSEMYFKATQKKSDKFKVITNGFDDENLGAESIIKDKKFSIAHIGTLVKDRNPEGLWKVLREIVKENIEFENQLEIKLVGKIDIYVREQIEKYELIKYLNKIDYLPHDEVIKEQKRSKVLLLLVNNTKNAKGILTGKFFEYMASQTPVLAIGPTDGDLAQIMNETGVGVISDFNDENTLKINILNLFNNSTQERNNLAVQNYSRKKLSEKLSLLLTEL